MKRNGFESATDGAALNGVKVASYCDGCRNSRRISIRTKEKEDAYTLL